MSKGFGAVQQRILGTLSQYPDGFYLASLGWDNNDFKSLNRAAWRLAEGGHVEIAKYAMGMTHIHCRDHRAYGQRGATYLGGPKLVVWHPQYEQCRDRDELERRYWSIRKPVVEAMKRMLSV